MANGDRDGGFSVDDAPGGFHALERRLRRRQATTTGSREDANAIRAILKLPNLKPGVAVADRLARATVWVSPTATDRRTAGVIVDVKRRWVLTSNRGVGPLDRVGVAFPVYADGKAVGDRDAYRDPVTLHLSGHWAIGTVVARDPARDLAMVELNRLPESHSKRDGCCQLA